MRKRFGILAALAAVVAVAGLFFGGRPESALAGGNTKSLNFDVPPTGTGVATLSFDTGATGLLEGFRFILGGDQHVRILNIATSSGTPEFGFTDASPKDVTQYFANNPFTTEVGLFTITVANSSDSTRVLHVTARWE